MKKNYEKQKREEEKRFEVQAWLDQHRKNIIAQKFTKSTAQMPPQDIDLPKSRVMTG